MGEKVSIYGLIDPRDESCFYVGRAYTRRLSRRLNEHVAGARRMGPDTRKHKTILAILEEGQRPGIESLEEMDESDGWGQAEQDKMDEYREFCELTNIAPGGQGPSNWNEVFTQAWNGNSERRQLVGKQSRERWKNPEYRKSTIEAIRSRFDDPEYRQMWSELQQRIWADNEEGRAKISEARKVNWQDPDYRERVTQSNVEAWSDPDLLAEHRERTTALWQDSEYRDKVVGRLNDPEVQGRRIEKLEELWSDPAKREQNAEAMRELWSDPETRERWLASKREAAPKTSESLKEYYADPIERERLVRQAAEYWASPEAREKQRQVSTEMWDAEFKDAWRRKRNNGKVQPDAERAAEILGVRPITVYKYCHQGRLGRKEGNSWVITDEDIARFRDGQS